MARNPCGILAVVLYFIIPKNKFVKVFTKNQEEKKGNLVSLSNYIKDLKKGGGSVYYPDDLIREIRESNDIVSVMGKKRRPFLSMKGNSFFIALGVAPEAMSLPFSCRWRI